MCRYVTQPSLLTALLKYLTVLLEYLDLFLQIPFWIIDDMDKWGLDNQGFIVLEWFKMHTIIQVFNIKQHIVVK